MVSSGAMSLGHDLPPNGTSEDLVRAPKNLSAALQHASRDKGARALGYWPIIRQGRKLRPK